MSPKTEDTRSLLGNLCSLPESELTATAALDGKESHDHQQPGCFYTAQDLFS